MTKGEPRHRAYFEEDTHANDDVLEPDSRVKKRNEHGDATDLEFYDSRLELNAKSLRMLCGDLESFLEKADNIVHGSEDENVNTVRHYFKRLNSLLYQIRGDLAERETKVRSQRRRDGPVHRLSDEFGEDMVEALKILKILDAVRRDDFVPDRQSRGHMNRHDLERHFPFYIEMGMLLDIYAEYVENFRPVAIDTELSDGARQGVGYSPN